MDEVRGIWNPRLGCLIFLALSLPMSLSCQSTPSEPELFPRTIEADEFVFSAYEGVTDAYVSAILVALTENSDRIKEHLRITNMPRIRVSIWSQTRMNDWDNAMRAAIGQVYPGATGYTPAPDRICLLFNAASPTESVHEYAHLVSMQVNPTIPNNPRWLWEAVAIYEAGVGPDLSTWSDGALAFPGFQALNQYNSALPYLWGFHIALAIIQRWGDDGFLELIHANGDIQGTFGITDAEFGEYVEGFVRSLAGL